MNVESNYLFFLPFILLWALNQFTFKINALFFVKFMHARTINLFKALWRTAWVTALITTVFTMIELLVFGKNQEVLEDHLLFIVVSTLGALAIHYAMIGVFLFYRYRARIKRYFIRRALF